MLLSAALLSAVLHGVDPTVVPDAVDAFKGVCGASRTMQAMEAAARAQGWQEDEYPSDIRAGFLAEMRRQSSSGSTIGYATIYSHPVKEGLAYLIVSRDEYIFGINLPDRHLCQLSLFDFNGVPSIERIIDEFKRKPNESWRDEQGNEVHNWYGAPKMQMSYVVSKTSLAGPADLSGLSLSLEYQENRK